MSFHPDWIIPDWPAPARVRAVCTTRAGGVSVAPFDSLNLGDHVRDDPVAVATNRRALQQAIAARPVFLQQVHGIAVATLDAGTPDATIADACCHRRPGCRLHHHGGRLPAGAADRPGGLGGGCCPRGLARTGRGGGERRAGVGFRVFLALSQRRKVTASYEKSSVEYTLAWLGPCIGPQAFEVGAEVRDAFCAADARAARCFTALGGGKFLADLPGLARQRLNGLGVTAIYGNDGSPAWCTFGNRARYFSHRRDALALGGSGRMAACVWLAD